MMQAIQQLDDQQNQHTNDIVSLSSQIASLQAQVNELKMKIAA